LLIIAGAGSGKMNTLAHRVAHLIVNGIDSRRILLMTFSRRAATEMAGRRQRLLWVDAHLPIQSIWSDLVAPASSVTPQERVQ
jgi:superfamily I DNA/RNA helicase